MLCRVRPSPAEKERLRVISKEIIAEIERLAEERGMTIEVMLVGSAARGTWLAHDHDLDIFLGVPEKGDLDQAMNLARLAAPEHEERDAEHPYVHARGRSPWY